MRKGDIQLSREFRIHAMFSILAIIAFVLVYLFVLIIVLAVALLCILGAVAMVSLKPAPMIVLVGIGLVSLGVFLAVFLLKFMFTRYKTDRSHMIEVTKVEQPELFALIDEIVTTVGTTFPKRVYLSAEVNAAVFYDSSFWSMFLPVRKNLKIGLGLVNTMTKAELKAVLAHEFGHFSQGTMKLGSYVYYLNRVIYNMLFDNESYERILSRWGDVTGFFKVFTILAQKTNEGILWILRKMYDVLNKSYLALSREMEFHADEIAASVTGIEPLKSSLLRSGLADQSYDRVIAFYNIRISKNIQSENIYVNQSDVLRAIAESNELPVSFGLPQVPVEAQSKYDRSRLTIEDPWASHPSVRDRITRLEQTGFNQASQENVLANAVFTDITGLQTSLTKILFDQVSYEGDITCLSPDGFLSEYQKEVARDSFPAFYRGYYDRCNPVGFELSDSGTILHPIDRSDLFSAEKVDWVYTADALNNDIYQIREIINGSVRLKRFDYDGVRYERGNAEELLNRLQAELKSLNDKIRVNNLHVYCSFLELEAAQGRPMVLERMYREYHLFDKEYSAKYKLCRELDEGLLFIYVETPWHEIDEKFRKLQPLEESIRKEMTLLLSDDLLSDKLSEDARSVINEYTCRTMVYYRKMTYNDDHLHILQDALRAYAYLLPLKYFRMKKAILVYQEDLLSCAE